MAPVAYTASDTPEKKPQLEHAYGLAKPTVQRPQESQVAIDDLSRRVREQSDKIREALTPYADALKAFAEARPVGFTWLAIFTALSFIPVLCFAGFVLAACAIVFGTALVIASAIIFGAFILASAVLLPVLFFTGFLATSVVGLLLGLFLAHRLVLHLRAATGKQNLSFASVSEGVRTWADETSSRVGLGDKEYRPLFSSDVVSKAIHKDDTASQKQLSPAKVKPSTPVVGHSPLSKSAKPFSPAVKNEPIDLFSPPQPGHHSLTHTESHDSEWTSASDVEAK